MNVEARDLVVRFRGGEGPVLDRVSISVPEGSLYAILGPNGSGKTTLMRVLLGALPAASGQVSWGGRPLERWSRRELARTIGAVAQGESIAFPLTVREMVSMGRYPHLGPLSPLAPEDQRAIDDALERCDVRPFSDRDVNQLSGGELQRVRLARALAQEPRALALDEPTSNLDVRHEMAIFGLLEESVSRGVTVLLVTHHLDLAARFADRMLLLEQGRVEAEGTPEEVLTEERLTRVFGWPLAVRRDEMTDTLRVVPMGGRAASTEVGPTSPPP